jgi:hypothetical protein
MINTATIKPNILISDIYTNQQVSANNTLFPASYHAMNALDTAQDLMMMPTTAQHENDRSMLQAALELPFSRPRSKPNSGALTKNATIDRNHNDGTNVCDISSVREESPPPQHQLDPKQQQPQRRTYKFCQPVELDAKVCRFFYCVGIYIYIYIYIDDYTCRLDMCRSS